jgi:hypothetical protein
MSKQKRSDQVKAIMLDLLSQLQEHEGEDHEDGEELREKIAAKYEQPATSKAREDGALPNLAVVARRRKKDGAGAQSNLLAQQSCKKFLSRFKGQVREGYLFTKQELKQKIATVNLFEAFDLDGSGALDSRELCQLYNEQGIHVTEDEIKLLYRDDKIQFTLQEFENITKDPLRLNHFRRVLKQLQEELKDRKQKNDLAAEGPIRISNCIPPTFDTMMIDFGSKVQHA